MNMLRKIKNIYWIRSCGFLFYKILQTIRGNSQFARCGKNVIITPPIRVGNYKNVFIGSNVGIGSNAYISAINAKFICKDHCAIAENLTVHTGKHARIVGLFVTDITEARKPKGYDHDVVVEDDVWIASNVTLLSGVTIGRGATIASGAVVTKSMPPYCVCGGVPAKFIKFYWTIEQILEHESKLYPESERYTREVLEEIFTKWL